MKLDEMKTVATVLEELNESYGDFLHAMKGTVREVKTARQLWRDKNGSKLVKLGLTLIVFPEPTPISETIGACLVAAGAVKKGIQNRSMYIEDVYKTFQSVLKDVRAAKHSPHV